MLAQPSLRTRSHGQPAMEHALSAAITRLFDPAPGALHAQAQAQAGVNVRRAAAGAVAAGQHVQARGLVQPAEQEAFIPEIIVDRVGAISVVGQDDPAHMPGAIVITPFGSYFLRRLYLCADSHWM